MIPKNLKVIQPLQVQEFWELLINLRVMATKNYSQRLSTFKQEIDNADLKDSLDSLRQYLSKRNLKILCWDEKILQYH